MTKWVLWSKLGRSDIGVIKSEEKEESARQKKYLNIKGFLNE